MPTDFSKLAVFGAIGLIVALYSFVHSRVYREGLPPMLDAFFSGVAFALLCAAFIYGGRIGAVYDMTTEGRIAGLGAATLLFRWFRARLAIELVRWRLKE